MREHMPAGTYLNGFNFANGVARNYGVLAAMRAMRETTDGDHKAGQCDALVILVSTDPRRGVTRG